MNHISSILQYELIGIGNYSIKIYDIAILLTLFVIAKGILWSIKKILMRKHSFTTIDKGNSYAIFQIIRYAVWTISIALGLETLGIKITILLAGSAALLVGIGLGLQEVFKDLISGIIILTDGTVKMDDVVEVDDEILKIQSIGLRTLKGITRNDIVMVIPNSYVITNKITNWSHQSERTRFWIDVGVAYGSNIDLVTKALSESVIEHPEINEKIADVRFVNFGNSSLDFQVFFYSKNAFGIEKIKSDIRRNINKKFTEYNITIPFPQVDIHMKHQ